MADTLAKPQNPPSARITIGLPDAYEACQGRLAIHHEEDALCWFWAYSDLMPWPAKIWWLYTPVVGNRRWPGDLWGVDEHGNLLIIECKQCRRRDDPFRDFVQYHHDGREEFTAAHWVQKWRKHLKAELAFPTSTAERPSSKTAGMLPRSNKRDHIRRWKALAQRIDLQIRSSDYQEGVQTALQVREGRGNPPPHYLALMVVSHDSPLITNGAARSGHQLERMVGGQRVHVLAAAAEVVPEVGLRVSVAMENLENALSLGSLASFDTNDAS